MLVLSARKLALMLSLLTLAFVPLSLYRTPIRQAVEDALPYQIQVDRLLRLGGEGSLSAWYATALFVACAALLWLVQRASPHRRAFAGLTAVTLLLALDQSILLHERLLAMWLTLAAGVSGWLPALAALLLLGLLLWRTQMWAVPARPYIRLAWLLIFAGYAAGVMLSLASTNDRLVEATPALLKMFGALSLLVATLRHLAQTAPSLALTFTSGRRPALWLAALSVLFTLLTAGFHLLNARVDLSVLDPYRLFYLLDSGQEATIPTFFSVVLWLLCAALLLLVTVGQRDTGPHDTRRWAILVALFTFLSLDEAASLHEQLIGLSRAVVSRLNLGEFGLFYHAWVIPVGLLLVLLFVLYIPFFRRLPRTTAAWILFSGILFVMGALGFEMIGGAVVTFDKNNDTLRLGVETIEELLEMLGLAGFVYALVEYLAHHIAPVQVRLRAPVDAANETPA